MSKMIGSTGLLLACGLLVGGCVTEDGGEETAPGDATEEPVGEAIRDVLETQVEAWNQGSIGGFMAGYARTDTLRFASGGNVWYGWDATERRYRETYIDEGMMGQLSFRDIDVWPISEENAVVFGRWRLDRSEVYQNTGGLFTLVFELTPDGWRIVHDHTSVAETIEAPDTSHAPPQADTAARPTPPQADTIDAK